MKERARERSSIPRLLSHLHTANQSRCEAGICCMFRCRKGVQWGSFWNYSTIQQAVLLEYVSSWSILQQKCLSDSQTARQTPPTLFRQQNNSKFHYWLVLKMYTFFLTAIATLFHDKRVNKREKWVERGKERQSCLLSLSSLIFQALM